MGWSRPRPQTCKLSPRAGRPEGLVALSAVEVWTKPMTDQGIYTQWFWSFCPALGHQLGMTFTQMINNTTKNQ